MSIWVLRLGHRLPRDERISTHCGLVARAFGAEGIIFSGQEDKGLIDSLYKISEKWGGDFQQKYQKNWKEAIRKFKENGYKVVLLTMYGENITKKINEIRKIDKILLIVGSEKIPGEIYGICDVQIAIGNQPHSEVAALAVFLDRYYDGKELQKEFQGKMRITQIKGKGK